MTTDKTASTRSSQLARRWLWFVAGLAVNSFGIALITSGDLGTSQISSVPYVMSLAWPGLSFSVTTFVVNVLFIVGQVVLLGRRFAAAQIVLQLVANVLFSGFLGLGSMALSWLSPTSLLPRLCAVLVGCVLLGAGIAIEVAPEVTLVPGEGIVRAIASVTGKRFGTVKVAFDVTLIVAACLLSLATMGGIRGVGLGTVITALVVGHVVNFVSVRLPAFGE